MLSGAGALQERWTMKLITGWALTAGLVFGAAAAQAQVPHEAAGSLYTQVSDFEGPYAAMPPEVAAPRPGPVLLPAAEVYTVVREAGFSPIGIPHRRGPVYTIAVVSRRGEDGRLVIDARNGQIVRFTPGYRLGGNFDEVPGVIYGSAGPLPPMSHFRGPPRPPASIPRVASRTPSTPLPKARAAEPNQLSVKPTPEPAQQSAAVQAKPANAVAAAPPQAAATAPVEAKPAAPSIQPTQEMPKAQGLE
jgi:hypothetical protein